MYGAEARRVLPRGGEENIGQVKTVICMGFDGFLGRLQEGKVGFKVSKSGNFKRPC